ncbi:hypothetical protein SEA_HIRKO_53 [Arthrobacter phage Hirko]|nr:hypothetical protein SEA_HIRKO_53 [Arthrobacter phage Hirko]
MTAEQVARPVHAIERPASMAMLVKTARALKVLHGPDLHMFEVGPKFVYFTPGDRCGCAACDDYLRKLAGLDWTYPSGMIVCTVCGNKRCPHATDHEEDCTGSNEPGQPGSAYAWAVPPGDPLADPFVDLAPPADSVRAFLATLPLHPDADA